MQSIDEDLCEHYESHDWHRRKLDEIDVELIRRAEIFSDKWVQLYKNGSTHNDDNFSQIVETTAIGGHHINRFNVQNSMGQHHLNSHPDSITERHKIILLDKKYFEFEASTNSIDVPIDTIDSNEKDDIEKYKTVFDHSNDQCDNDLDSNSSSICNHINEKIIKPPLANHKTQEKPQLKTNKKKKGRTKYRPLTSDDDATVAANTNVLAAPPGVKVISPLINPRRMDLTKSGNYSLQFRL